MRREQIATAGIGLLAAFLVGAGLMVVGGPEQGRAERRDAKRMIALRTYSECLTRIPAADLASVPNEHCQNRSLTGVAGDEILRFELIGSKEIRVCTRFEYPERQPTYGINSDFDAATGCLTRKLPD